MNSGVVWSKSAVLKLYRACLRRARTVTLTDQDFILNRIKNEFRKNQFETSAEQNVKSLERGLAFLRQNRVI